VLHPGTFGEGLRSVAAHITEPEQGSAVKGGSDEVKVTAYRQLTGDPVRHTELHPRQLRERTGLQWQQRGLQQR
jgi:hypothetical protein